MSSFYVVNHIKFVQIFVFIQQTLLIKSPSRDLWMKNITSSLSIKPTIFSVPCQVLKWRTIVVNKLEQKLNAEVNKERARILYCEGLYLRLLVNLSRRGVSVNASLDPSLHPCFYNSLNYLWQHLVTIFKETFMLTYLTLVAKVSAAHSVTESHFKCSSYWIEIGLAGKGFSWHKVLPASLHEYTMAIKGFTQSNKMLRKLKL